MKLGKFAEISTRLAPLVVLSAVFGAGTGTAQESKNLFEHGFAASSYGDLLMEKGTIRKEDIAALRLRAGVQLLHLGPVGMSLGYQKIGFYTATYSSKRESGSFNYDYRGPVLELHVMPRSFISLSVAASTNKGFLYREEDDSALFAYSCGANCQVLAERTEISLQEYTGQIGVFVARQLQLTLGFGTRAMEGKGVAYQTSLSKSTAKEFVDDPSQDWKEKGTFITFGLRGTTL